VQRWNVLLGGLGLCLATGCAGQAAQSASAHAGMPAWGESASSSRRNAAVSVRGIEGTLSSYDVNDTMERRNEEFAACHEPRASVVPVLAGRVEFGIQVAPDGTVRHVDVRESDLGDRVLERCFVDVIAQTPFPRPHGGQANVTYTMMLEPARPGHEAESWSVERIERTLAQRASPLRATCGLAPRAGLVVTAYVNPRGRVVAAGVSAHEGVTGEQFDCVAEDLRSWPMPKSKHGLAKVSFPIAE
jgi:hypothetical protein